MTRSGWGALVGLGVAAAIALRSWVLASPFGALDSDEAVWGLMARHVLDGELPLFFWGQAYGGTQEVFLTAGVFAAVGSSPLTLRLVPLALFVVAALLVWRVGRRTVGEPAARIGAVVFAVWPAYLIWKSTHAHGFYGSALVLSLLVLLFVARLAVRESVGDLSALGLSVGLGWWATPQTALVSVPALAWLAWQRPHLIRLAWMPLVAATLSALPWLGWNVGHGWQSLEVPFGRGGDSYVDHLRTFGYATFPTLLGLRVPFSLEWVAGELVGRTLELAAVVALIVAGLTRSTLLLAVLVAYPFLQALSPFGSLNEEPRYLVLLAPVLALLIASLLASRLWRAAAGTAALVALSIAGLVAMSGQKPSVPPVGGVRTPADLDPVLARLDRAGVRFALAPYATAYRISFLTDERIVASSTGQVRYRPHDRLVRRNRHAFAFAAGERDAVTKAPELRRAGYRRLPADDWVVYLPPKPG